MSISASANCSSTKYWSGFVKELSLQATRCSVSQESCDFLGASRAVHAVDSRLHPLISKFQAALVRTPKARMLAPTIPGAAKLGGGGGGLASGICARVWRSGSPP